MWPSSLHLRSLLPVCQKIWTQLVVVRGWMSHFIILCALVIGVAAGNASICTVWWGSRLYSFRVTPPLGDNYSTYCLSQSAKQACGVWTPTSAEGQSPDSCMDSPAHTEWGSRLYSCRVVILPWFGDNYTIYCLPCWMAYSSLFRDLSLVILLYFLFTFFSFNSIVCSVDSLQQWWSIRYIP